MFSKLFFITFLTIECQSVPFVTKRVSLHNPITIDFSGWRPLRAPSEDQLQTADSSQQPSYDNHFLTVPVAVETDAEHVLSETDLNQIREHVISNWRQKPIKSESFPHLSEFVTKLLPKPEIEKETDIKSEEDSNEYTFVKMDKNGNSTEENLFHAYFANKEHIPPEGYIRLTKSEFKNVFKNAEILFI